MSIKSIFKDSAKWTYYRKCTTERGQKNNRTRLPSPAGPSLL